MIYLKKAILILMMMSTVFVAYAGTDGDGFPDNIDLDDDNDGILDVNESEPCDPFRIIWNHNGSSGGQNGQSDAATYNPNSASSMFTSAANATFGAFPPGIDEATDNSPFNYVLRGADQANFASAKANNDYVEFAFVPNQNMQLSNIQLGFFTSNAGNPDFNMGNFKIAMEHDD